MPPSNCSPCIASAVHWLVGAYHPSRRLRRKRGTYRAGSANGYIRSLFRVIQYSCRLFREPEAMLDGIRYFLIQDRIVASRCQVIRQNFQRPYDDVAMTLFLLNCKVFIKHEPLRPVAIIFVLVSVDHFDDIANLLIFLRCHKVLHRTLAHIPCTPSRAAVLLQTVRYGVVNQHVVGVPPRQRINFEQILCTLTFATGQTEPVHHTCEELAICLYFLFERQA